MKKPPVEFLAEALRAIEALDAVDIGCRKFATSSPAATENAAATRAGVDPKADFITIPGVHLHLHLKLFGAREHLLGCLALVRSNAVRTLVNPIRVLVRSAVESSVTCLWLCSSHITPVERLRRFSQLHLKSAYNDLRDEGVDPINLPDLSSVSQDIAPTLEECNTVIDEVKARGWTCRRGKNEGKTPTISMWVKELPAYSDLMKDASTIIPAPPESLRAFYSMVSKSVHTDPVTVASGSTEEDEFDRLSCALDAIAMAFAFYGLACELFARWCSVPYPKNVLQSCFAEMSRLALD